MGKNAKLGIGALVVVLLALAAATQGPLIGIGVLVVGGLGLVVLYQRLPDDDDRGDGGDGGSAPKKKGKELTGKKRLDALLDSQAEGGTTSTKSRPAPAPTGEGLPTWGGGLDTWTPPAEEAEVAEEAPANNWDTWDNNWSGDDADTLTLDTENPLDNLDQLDDIDPIAEVERIDAGEDSISFDEFEEEWSVTDDAGTDTVEDTASEGAFSFGSAPPIINEDVTSADDIMAASHATELDEEATDDSELAKLLAKVQARLAAYE